ncbi:nuclear transport factor 2 family protein [Phenylobacterium sp.]|uniref:YybH family protein n=1 Tax=Phenylobacterium sp. TaxID=1871053 RepID=UPI0035653DEE
MAGPFETLDEALAEAHLALVAIANGDPSVYLGLFAQREEISLGNPFGPFGCGREAVGRNLANAASKYRDGEVLDVERLATYASGDIACFVEVEHVRARIGPGGEFGEGRARVTTIYERRDGGWSLVHRHADPITTARGVESVLTA